MNRAADFAGFGVNVVPMFDHIYGDRMKPALGMLLLGALSLIACGRSAQDRSDAMVLGETLRMAGWAKVAGGVTRFL